MIVNLHLEVEKEKYSVEFEVDIPQKYKQRKILMDFIKGVVQNEIKDRMQSYVFNKDKANYATEMGKVLFYAMLDKYIENMNLLKSAKNVHERDPRYFDFYDSVSVEDLDDKIQNYQYLSQGRSLGNKFLKGYSHLMYDIIDGVKVLDKGVASAMSDLKIYLDSAKDNDELTYRMEKIDREMMSKIKGWDRENLINAINKITQERYDLNSVREQIKGKESDAEIIWNSDDEKRFAISVYNYNGSKEHGALKWCISTDIDYFNEYFYSFDDILFPKIQVMVRLSDCNNIIRDNDGENILNPLREIGITFDLDGTVSDAFDADDNWMSREELERVFDCNELNVIYENALRKYHPLKDVKDRIYDYLEINFSDQDIQKDLLDYNTTIYTALIGMYVHNKKGEVFLPSKKIISSTIEDHKKYGDICLVKNDEVLDLLTTALLSINSEANNISIEIINELIELGRLEGESLSDLSDSDIDYLIMEDIVFSDISWGYILESDTGDIYNNSSVDSKIKFDNLFIKNKTYLDKSISELEAVSAQSYWSGFDRDARLNYSREGWDYSVLMASMVENLEYVIKENMSNEALNYLINTSIVNSNKRLSDNVIDLFIEKISLKKDLNINSVLELLMDSKNPENAKEILRKIPDSLMNKENISSSNILRLLKNKELQKIIGFRKMRESCKEVLIRGDFDTSAVNKENKRVSKIELPENGYKKGAFVDALKSMVELKLIVPSDLEGLRRNATLSFGDQGDLSKYIDALNGSIESKKREKTLNI